MVNTVETITIQIPAGLKPAKSPRFSGGSFVEAQTAAGRASMYHKMPFYVYLTYVHGWRVSCKEPVLPLGQVYYRMFYTDGTIQGEKRIRG
jgi:hypothetical protein